MVDARAGEVGRPGGGPDLGLEGAEHGHLPLQEKTQGEGTYAYFI